MHTTSLKYSREFQDKCPACKRESIDVLSNNHADGLTWSIHFMTSHRMEPLLRCDMSSQPYERPSRKR